MRELSIHLINMHAGVFQYERAYRFYQSGTFRYRDEFFGRDESPLGMHPSGQSLEPGYPLFLNIHNRLVVDKQFAAANSFPEVVLEVQRINGLRMHTAVKNRIL